MAGRRLAGAARSAADPTTLPAFDFTRAQVTAKWKPVHDIASVEPTPEGLVIHLSGPDPYLVGPRVDFPEGVPLRLYAGSGRIRRRPASSITSAAGRPRSSRFGSG